MSYQWNITLQDILCSLDGLCKNNPFLFDFVVIIKYLH